MRFLLFIIAVGILGIAVWMISENKVEVITQECAACQECTEVKVCESIVKEAPKYITKEVIKEVIKEVPVEKIVYRDIGKTITVADPQCHQDLVACNNQRAEVFNLYYKARSEMSFYIVTTTDVIAHYGDLLSKLDQATNLIFELNRDYAFQPTITSRIIELRDFASTSRAFLNKYK